jgi:two-component system response regulator PilR (NtrC family)
VANDVEPRNGAILVIDDEEIMREILEALLTREGYEVTLAAGGAEGIELARAKPFDAAVVDVMMPEMDGLETLDGLKKLDEEIAVIMITAFASVETAIAAMKRGALDYITKPFKNDEVLLVLRNAVERKRLVTENRSLRQNLQERYHRFDNIIGKSPAMRRVFDLIIQAAPSRSTILIEGESGTGKELIARAIHTHSARSDRAFVTVNSGSLPPDLLESTLFGHVKGAFTGAVYLKKGLCDLADKGSIFFDEIGNIPLETQAKLLRVMQEREFCASAAWRPSRSTSASSPPPTSTSSTRWRRAASARTSSTGCTSSASSCRRCASAATTSRSWCSTSSRSTARRTNARASSSRTRRSTC